MSERVGAGEGRGTRAALGSEAELGPDVEASAAAFARLITDVAGVFGLTPQHVSLFYPQAGPCTPPSVLQRRRLPACRLTRRG